MKLAICNVMEEEYPIMYETLEKYGIEGVPFTGRIDNNTPDELAGQGFDAAVVVPYPMDYDYLKRFKDAGINILTTRSIGYDHFDLEAAKELGLTICNSSYPPESVAGYAVMLILMCARRMAHILPAFSHNDFTIPGCRGNDLSELTIGIVGTGKIGATVAKRLRGFDCKIVAFDIYENPALKDYVEYVSLEELLKRSDIITLHAFASKENTHLINAERLALMKPTAYIVNTARGTLIDTWALIDALYEGKIEGAALDVVEEEDDTYYRDFQDRLLPRHIAMLKEMPNVILTPHMAFCTTLSRAAQMKTCIEASYLAYTKAEKNPFKIV